jgi:hypothetical protein
MAPPVHRARDSKPGQCSGQLEGNDMTSQDTVYDLQHEIDDLLATADWRRRKAEEHPDDGRNTDAALLLERLAEELPKLAGSISHKKLDALLSGDESDAYYFVEFANEYRRRIGFSAFPQTAAEYLADLARLRED